MAKRKFSTAQSQAEAAAKVHQALKQASETFIDQYATPLPKERAVKAAPDPRGKIKRMRGQP